jgi:FkbM family methyltransferase
MPIMPRRLLRRICDPFFVQTGHFGSILLRSSRLRRVSNLSLERLGPRYGDLFHRLFNGAKPSCAFAWECGFADRKFEIPVTPEFPRSWGNARVWRWCGNRPIRRFYEFYLGAFGSGRLFDIGANDGTHTYPFASHGYDCTCFEPQARCIAYIERVCQLNGFSNVTIQHCAAGDKDCPGVEFHVSSSSWYSSLDRERVERWEASTPVRVEMISLDSYCRRRGVEPTLIKIDVEGCEARVLQGGGDLFRRLRPDAFIEVTLVPENVRDIWGFFSKLGYRCLVIQPAARRPFLPIEDVDHFLEAGAVSAMGGIADVIFLTDFRVSSELSRLT